MSVVITDVFVKLVDFSGDFKVHGDYLSCAAKNAGIFAEWDQSYGDHGYELRSESESELEEKLMALCCAYEMCLLHKIYVPNGDIEAIDINEIITFNGYDYNTAWSDSARHDISLNGVSRAISNKVGNSMIGFTNDEDQRVVVFYNSRQNLEKNDDYDSFEEALEDYPENTTFSDFDIGETAYGDIVTMPIDMAQRYFDTSDLDFD